MDAGMNNNPTAESDFVDLPFTTADTASARLGLVVLASDYTIESEFRQILHGSGIETFVSRIEMSTTVTPETLAAMEKKIAAAAELILPGDHLDMVGYCCTSASVVLGEQTVVDQVHNSKPDAQVTTPITAAFAAFSALGARRIGVLTPYRRDVNEKLKAYIEKAGFAVPLFASFNEENDPTVARIDRQSIADAVAMIVDRASVDMVFVSCTSVRMAAAVADIEKRVGKPVTSSNLAMGWHVQRSLGISRSQPEFGKLYDLPLS
jgi:maleate isomerase